MENWHIVENQQAISEKNVGGPWNTFGPCTSKSFSFLFFFCFSKGKVFLDTFFLFCPSFSFPGSKFFMPFDATCGREWPQK